MIDPLYGIVGSTTGSNYYVRVLSTIDRELLKPTSSVALHRLYKNILKFFKKYIGILMLL